MTFRDFYFGLLTRLPEGLLYNPSRCNVITSIISPSLIRFLIMSSEKPVILLIPGAWHQAQTFDPVVSILQAQGYRAEAMKLLSAGGPPSTNLADDAEHIRQTSLNHLIAQGKEVVVVMHSYSGLPGTESVKGLLRTDLAAQGKNGGVVALVYITAFLLKAGESVQSIMPDGLDPVMTFDVGVNVHIRPCAGPECNR